MNAARSRWFDSAWRVSAIYTLVTAATTWPLVGRLTTSLPSDLGDPLLNAFIVQWGIDHLLTLAGGDLGAFRDYWHAPIFHPEPLALAYSEHLFSQAAQAAPIFLATGNILLCYNLLFLGTFVLSGLGAYLLSRELTGSGAAGFVAGLLYAFALYRVAQFPHLQTLSSQWLPFALYGLRRFFTTRRWRPLAAATLALVAQNLSNGYFLVFFTPFVVAYCVYEIVDRRLWTDVRVVGGIALAGLVTIALTVPFLVPYLVLRAKGFEPRAFGEVHGYSADLLAWVTTAPSNRVWGWLRTYPKAEGELFPGVVTMLLAAAGFAARLRTVWRAAPATRGWPRLVVPLLLLIAGGVAVFALVVMGTGDAHWRFYGQRVTLRAPWKAWTTVALLLVAVAALSGRVRVLLRGLPGSAFGFFAASGLISALLALGPVIDINGVPTGLPAPYMLLYDYVPGFDGLRVPARYAMLTACCLSVVGGFGVRALLARGRLGVWLATCLTLLFLVESTGAPISIDEPLNAGGYESGPHRIFLGDEVAPVYRFARSLSGSTVLVEFPFGTAAWDLQYQFYQRVHGHPLVNGYSGGFPQSFDDNAEAFRFVSDVPEAAWRRLMESGATHVIVHRGAFTPPGADIVETWLVTHGATPLRAFGDDRIFTVPHQ